MACNETNSVKTGEVPRGTVTTPDPHVGVQTTTHQGEGEGSDNAIKPQFQRGPGIPAQLKLVEVTKRKHPTLVTVMVATKGITLAIMLRHTRVMEMNTSMLLGFRPLGGGMQSHIFILNWMHLMPNAPRRLEGISQVGVHVRPAQGAYSCHKGQYPSAAVQ